MRTPATIAGHPIHPMLVPIPIGLWIFSLVCDLIHAGGSTNPDPVRTIEAVTAGIAFLGAGAIFQQRGSVQGLTTGAGMWLAGAIGVACGLGLWQIALFATVLALAVLVLLYAFENKMDMNQGEDFTEDEQDETSRRATKAKGDKPEEAEPAR